MPDADRRRPLIGALEAIVAGAAGGALGGVSMAVVGLTGPGVVVGAVNGLLGGWRATYSWRRPQGPLAFALDSTWALPMTAAALVAHAVAVVQRDRGGYVDELSRRADRHVYQRGFRLRRGFLVTIGNTVHGAGPQVGSSARRQQIVTDHEDVHVWQGRWFGPLYPVLYGGWLLAGGAVGGIVWLARRRDQPFTAVVETCAYYLNPFEWWAYSRDGHWPPGDMVASLGWQEPCVRPLSETRRRALRPARPAQPAAPR